MNRTIKILLTVFCLLASTNFGFAMREGYGEYEIDLQGKIPPIGRSQSEPLSASHDDANLYVDFHADLGSLTITISNATGAVVNTETVYAQANEGVQISLSNLPSGNYLVVFSARQGSMMGKFNI